MGYLQEAENELVFLEYLEKNKRMICLYKNPV